MTDPRQRHPDPERALLEKIAEGRNVLAYGLPPELLEPLARRSRLLLATNDADVLLGLPDGGFALLVAGRGAATEGVLRFARLRSPAGVFGFYDCADAETARDLGVLFHRAGRLVLTR